MADDADDVSGEMIALPFERLARLMRAAEHDAGLNPAQWEALRYLSRAIRFSNSPGALTRYLGATKGTISQTVIALERKGFITKAFVEVPRIPLFQPYLNVALQKNIGGYSYWFHRQLDYRSLSKA